MSFVKPPQPPVLFNGTLGTILTETQDLIDERIKLWNGLGQNISPETATVDNFITPIIQNENHLLARQNVLCFYGTISPDKELRDVSHEASRMFTNAEIDLFFRNDIFQLVHAMIQRQENGQLQVEPELVHFLRKFHLQFIQNGCGLPQGPERDHFREKLKQLKEYEKQFQINLHEDKTGIWLFTEDLKGVPTDFIQSLKQGDGDQEGQVWLPMKNALTNQVLKYAQKEPTRRQVFTFNQNRLNDKNISLHQNIVLLRDELARLLGYHNHAEFKVQERMISSVEDITGYLEEVRLPLALQAQKQIAKLLELKRAEVGAQSVEGIRLFYWDKLYYERILDEREASVDFEMISEYFELLETLKRLMSIYEHIFDIKFELIDDQRAQQLFGDNARYLRPQDDFLVFMVTSQSSNRFIGYVNFDFHPRDGKFGHVGHYGLQPGYMKSDGSRYYPSGVIVTNYRRPSESKPCLLAMAEVRSLFHEMGHALHNVLSITKCARFHGTRTERDFVEIPSVMFEYFFWTTRHIKEVSCHYTYQSLQYKEAWLASFKEDGKQRTLPTQQLSDKTVDELVKLKSSNKYLDLLKDVHYATYDMIMHTPKSHEELSKMNLCETFNKTRNDIMCLEGGEALGEGWEWGHFESIFRHVNGGRYDVGYYAYVIGRVWAIDLFDATFKTDTMNKQAGQRYRDEILRFGGSKPAMKILTDFLGRKPRPNAFYEWMGIKMNDLDEA